MKNVFAIAALLLLLMGCQSVIVEDPVLEEKPSEEVVEPEEEIVVERPAVEEPEEEEEVVEEPVEPEGPSSRLPEEVRKIIEKSSKVRSYSYLYHEPKTNIQYRMWVKGTKIRIESLSDVSTIYLDTEKKTAERYCISRSRCGRQTGKMEDLQYGNVYLETPFEWALKFEEAELKSESDYQGKESVLLYTEVGEIIMDQNFGFVYMVTMDEDNIHRFRDASFNTVDDDDVVPPEYLVPQ